MSSEVGAIFIGFQLEVIVKNTPFKNIGIIGKE